MEEDKEGSFSPTHATSSSSSSRRKWDMSPEHQASVLTKIQAMSNTLEKLSPERRNSQTLIKKLVKARKRSISQEDVNEMKEDNPSSSSSSSSSLERQIEVLGMQNDIVKKGSFSNNNNHNNVINNSNDIVNNDESIVVEQFQDSLLLDKYAASSSSDSIITSEILRHFEEYKKIGKKSDVLESMICTLETLIESDEGLNNKKHIELLGLLYNYM